MHLQGELFPVRGSSSPGSVAGKWGRVGRMLGQERGGKELLRRASCSLAGTRLSSQRPRKCVSHHRHQSQLQTVATAVLLMLWLCTCMGVHGHRGSFDSASQWLRHSRFLGSIHSDSQNEDYLSASGRLLADKRTVVGRAGRLLASPQCKALQDIQRWLQPKSWTNATSNNASLSCTCSAWNGVTCDTTGKVVALKLMGAKGGIEGPLSALSAVTSLLVEDGSLDKASGGQILSLPSLRRLVISGSFGDKPHFQDLVVLSSATSLQSLKIQDAGFQGAFPEELSALKSLATLEIVGNSLAIIPDWLSSITSLQKLTITRAEVYQALPAHLGSLPSLQWLDLSGNAIWSSIPSQLFNSSSLQHLNLSFNNLIGPIPKAVSSTARLTHLDLSSNRLSGVLPQELFRLPRLQRLLLDGNLLRGPWPSFMYEARDLRQLSLSGNRFTGSFPSPLLTLSKLEILSLSRNELEGSIPAQISRMRSLRVAVLNNNNFSGTLDPLASMPWLEVLILSNNSFAGFLPSRLSDLRNLTFAVLDGNRLQGPFPTFFASLKRLQGLSLGRNAFSGTLPTLTKWVGQFLDLGYNNFTGNLPHLSLVHQLQYISLAHNQLSGSLGIEALSSLTGLKRISLRGNQFTGDVPDMSAFPALEWLDLAYNRFTHVTLSASAPLRALRFLDLSGNQLSSFPTALAEVSSLTYLGIARNGLTGSIPSALADLRQLAALRLDSNALSGAFPPALCQLLRLSFLSLRSNSFYGWLHPCLSNMPRLQVADLGNNLFFGPWPANFANTPKLLALENNFLSGRLPLYIQGEPFCPGQVTGQGQSKESFYWNDYPGPVLRYTGVSSLAGNCFGRTGRWCAAGVPFEKQRNRTQCFQVCSSSRDGIMCGGHGACLVNVGPPPSFTCKCDKGYESAAANGSVSCVPEPPPEPPNSGLPLAAALGIAFTAALALAVLVLGCILIKRQPKARRRWSDLDVCQEFTLQEIEKATENWAFKNLLGQGGYGVVYLGRSPRGELWAVKRAKLLTNDFEKEVRAMASLHHPNLVRLLGFSLHYDVATACQEQILVYEFCAGGDLRKRMQDVDVPLSLGQRLSIAIGAAEGLAYLHSFANPIVHRDVKAANILLEPAGEMAEEVLRAKVADFGLLKKLSGDDATRIAGTPGYMDPEYFKTQTVTPRVDVYSFGVVLLELITGTPAVSEERHLAGLGPSGHIVGMCQKLFEDSRADELLDPSLEAPEEAVLELTLVAMDCVRVPGMARPSMSDVAARLKALMRRFEGQLDEFACSSCSDFGSSRDV